MIDTFSGCMQVVMETLCCDIKLHTQNGVQKVNGSSFHSVTFTVHNMPNKLNTCTTAFQCIRWDVTCVYHIVVLLFYSHFQHLFITNKKSSYYLYTQQKHFIHAYKLKTGFFLFFLTTSELVLNF